MHYNYAQINPKDMILNERSKSPKIIFYMIPLIQIKNKPKVNLFCLGKHHQSMMNTKFYTNSLLGREGLSWEDS